MRSSKDRRFATKEQELLLQAALLQGTEANHAWEEWKGRVDVEAHHDAGSYRIMPLLYKNLKRCGIEDPFISKLKGIYRKSWYENQTLFYNAGKTLEYLHGAGIKTMLLKGAPLAIFHYKDLAARPMSDIDILVPSSQVTLTLNLLRDLGYKPITPGPMERILLCRVSVALKCDSGTELDLHWRPYLHCPESSCKDFWHAAVPLEHRNVSTLAPDSTDLLFHVLVHGVESNPLPPIRWIADATTLINSTDASIDWMRLINRAKKESCRLIMRETLNYLHVRFQARIPHPIMLAVNRLHISPFELTEFHFRLNNWEGKHIRAFMELLLQAYRFKNASRSSPRVVGILDYLQYYYHARSPYDLFATLLAQYARRILKDVSVCLRPHDQKKSDPSGVDICHN